MTTTTPNPFALVDALPSSFREVHGERPRRFRSHEETSAWLARMEDATLVSATNAVAIYETTGDQEILADAKAYLAANEAIRSLREG